MRIIRFINNDNSVSIGVINERENVITDLTDIDHSLTDVITLFNQAKKESLTTSKYIEKLLAETKQKRMYHYNEVKLLTPVHAPEVWACGVTYQDSRRARNAESKMRDLKETFYDKVYSADRPELFLKSTERRTKATNEPLMLRGDSNWIVPEPELSLVVTSNKELVGFTIGNDLSSRDIEGENPLYLPQAKIWNASCSIGPAILLADSVINPYNIEIICRITRNEKVVFYGTANTKQLNRTFEELMEYLFRYNTVYDGTVLMTGTCIVPPDEFTLQDGDIVEIEIPSIGTLVNPIVEGKK